MNWIFESFGNGFPSDIRHVATVLCCGHLDSEGGYPYDSDIIGDEFVVASTDDFKENAATKLDRYNLNDLRNWERRARRRAKTMDMFDAVYETER